MDINFFQGRRLFIWSVGWCSGPFKFIFSIYLELYISRGKVISIALLFSWYYTKKNRSKMIMNLEKIVRFWFNSLTKLCTRNWITAVGLKFWLLQETKINLLDEHDMKMCSFPHWWCLARGSGSQCWGDGLSSDCRQCRRHSVTARGGQPDPGSLTGQNHCYMSQC